MEIAVNQLRKTIGKADQYFAQDSEKLAAVIRSHVQDLAEDVGFVERYRSSFKEKEQEYLELIAEARELKRDMEKAAFSLEASAKKSAPQSTPGGAKSSSSSVKLPRIQLPTFDGESGEDYRGFMDAFQDALTADPEMTDIKKWLLLRAQLQGRARNLVKELPMAPETYQVAVKLLENSYGSQKRAVLKLYQRLQDLSQAEMTTESLRATSAQLEGILLSLQHFKVKIDEDDFLRAVSLSKFPNDLIHFLRVTDDTTLAEFRLEVQNYVRLRDCTIQPARAPLTEVSSNKAGTKGGVEGQPSKKPRHLQGTQNAAGGSGTPLPPSQVTGQGSNASSKKSKDRTRSCVFCTGNHWNDECDVHKTLEERLPRAADRCQRCLKPKHVAEEECKSRRVCFYCRDATHNSALCPKKFSKVLLARQEEVKTSKACKFITAVLSMGNTARTKGEEVRTVLDTCGGRALITAEMAERLQLSEGGGRKMRFVGVNNAPLQKEASSARKLLLYPPGYRPIEIDVYVVPEIVTDVESTDVAELKKKYPRYADLPMPREGNGEKVHLLLGYKALTSIVTLQHSVLVEPHLQLMSTKFGYVPFGSLTQSDGVDEDSAVVGLIKEMDPVRLMSDLELIGLGDFLLDKSKEEELVLQKFYDTIEREGKRYNIEWPYNTADPALEDNFGLAFGRLVSLYRQLAKTPTLLKAYDQLIRDQLQEGIVEPVNIMDRGQGRLIHYLPHRAVIRLGKNTPIRMVFDAAAKCRRTAKSLNDVILKGGNWVGDIPAILLRFRRFSVAVASDISRAFHQIGIAPKDRDVVRFLWLRDPNKPPSKENLCVYRFKRMAFGVVASPFLLTATIRHHLRAHPNEFTGLVERDMYADNLITSLPSTVDGGAFYHKVKESFADMSMDLSQWATDDDQMRSYFTAEDALPETIQSVLGLEWNTRTREMGVRSPRLSTVRSGEVTKRVALKEMATVYDPLGWVAPVVLRARLFIRRIWQTKRAWDEPLDAALTDEWYTLREELNAVELIRLPRPYGFGGLEKAKQIEMHVFSDASMEAYGVVIYLCVRETGRTWTGLVAAKTRLTPSTKLSIPKLELLAAVVACRYAKYVETALEHKEKITKYLWSDSRCVIAWATSVKVLPAFIERAVKVIQAAGMKRFSYVPTAQNPADCVSRGATVNALREAQWYLGPPWLSRHTDWPVQRDAYEEEELETATELLVEEETARVLLINSAVSVRKTVEVTRNDGAPFEIDPNAVGTLGALLRRTAFCLKAKDRFFKKIRPLPRDKRMDYAEAWRLWITWDQNRVYEPASVTNVSYLRNLRVSTDESGIMRCHTRIGAAKVSRDEAEPILLVKKSALTRLIVLSTHSNNMHAGTSHTLAALRKRFWLPQGRREVFQTIKEHCFTCRREKARPFRTPEIAALPAFRINRTETPFTNVGVDAFGPYKIRIGHEKDAPVKKCWVLIFTCMVVRAVHLEILYDMSALEFLNCFRRFTGRRGVPRRIVCDNAPQFYAVEGYFQCVWRRFAEADVTEKYYAQHGIEWHFVPAESPWMGGAYERLIKEVKNSFGRVYGNLILPERQFEIAMIEVEGVINSRPITYVDRSEEADLITPNDFLCARYPAIPVDFTKAPLDSPLSGVWKASLEYLEQFWRDWSERYLREIRERRDVMPQARNEEKRSPLVGEVVLMIDPSLKRSCWRTAVVERLITSSDGKVRSVQLRAANRSRMIRPVSKLASLRLLADLPEEMGELTDQNRAVVVDPTGGEINVE